MFFDSKPSEMASGEEWESPGGAAAPLFTHGLLFCSGLLCCLTVLAWDSFLHLSDIAHTKGRASPLGSSGQYYHILLQLNLGTVLELEYCNSQSALLVSVFQYCPMSQAWCIQDPFSLSLIAHFPSLPITFRSFLLVTINK